MAWVDGSMFGDSMGHEGRPKLDRLLRDRL